MCDESFSPIVEEELAVFHAMYPDAHVTAKYTNEIDAFNALMKQDVHLIITARNLSKKQLEYFKSMKIQPRYFPLGYDGLAFIINKNNVDSCITVKDIKRILSGQATKWNQINKGSKFGTIDVVFDNKQSAAVRWAVDSILGGKPINSPNISAVNTSAEVIKYVEKTPNAIGIIGSNWLNDKRDTTNVTFKKNITVMPDGEGYGDEQLETIPAIPARWQISVRKNDLRTACRPVPWTARWRGKLHAVATGTEDYPEICSPPLSRRPGMAQRSS